MTKLFLDDTRNPPDSSWTVVRSYEAFVEHIEKNGVPELISFDHDLAEEHYAWGDIRSNWQIPYEQFTYKTGLQCATWLIARGTLPQQIIVHSLNSTGRANILKAFEEAFKARR